MKALQLGINYGMGVMSLSRGLGRHPMIGSEVIIRHQQRYPNFWAWRAEMVQRAMLERSIVSEYDGWPLHLAHSPNRRTLYNFPMQSGGAEMLRLAANRLCDADLVPIMLVHDGILFEFDNEEQVEHAMEIMRAAGRDVCGGFEIGVDEDQKLIGGARYRDKRPVAHQDVGRRDGDAAGDRRDRRCRLMSKRLNSNYPLAPRDFYPTPFKAVQPLIPHLDGIRRFAEPCCGEGDLVRHLESFGLRCVYAGDIATGQDALELTSDDIAGAPIITNPPFSRQIATTASPDDGALPAHRSGDLAAAAVRLRQQPMVRSLPAVVHRHRRDRPGQMDRGHRGSRLREFGVVSIQRPPCRRTGLPRQRQGRSKAVRSSPVRAMLPTLPTPAVGFPLL